MIARDTDRAHLARRTGPLWSGSFAGAFNPRGTSAEDGWDGAEYPEARSRGQKSPPWSAERRGVRSEGRHRASLSADKRWLRLSVLHPLAKFARASEPPKRRRGNARGKGEPFVRNPHPAHTEPTAAGDAMLSIRLLRVAMVHLTLRAPENAPRRTKPESADCPEAPIETFGLSWCAESRPLSVSLSTAAARPAGG